MDYAWGANGLDAIITQVILRSLIKKAFFTHFKSLTELHVLNLYTLLYKMSLNLFSIYSIMICSC